MVKSLEAERAEEATLDDEEKMIKFQARDSQTKASNFWYLFLEYGVRTRTVRESLCQGRYCDRLAELTGETKVGGQGGKTYF